MSLSFSSWVVCFIQDNLHLKCVKENYVINGCHRNNISWYLFHQTSHTANKDCRLFGDVLSQNIIDTGPRLLKLLEYVTGIQFFFKITAYRTTTHRSTPLVKNCRILLEQNFTARMPLRDTVVERRSLAGELSLSCAQPATLISKVDVIGQSSLL